MFLLEDTTVWTAEDALGHLRQALPPELRIETSVTPDGMYLALKEGVGEEEVIRWEGYHLDDKILYLTALGWVTRKPDRSRNPIWVRRHDEVPLARPGAKQDIPDPPDLDPDEVDAVYRTSR